MRYRTIAQHSTEPLMQNKPMSLILSESLTKYNYKRKKKHKKSMIFEFVSINY